MPTKKHFLVFIPIVLALALFLGLRLTIQPAQAAGGGLDQMPQVPELALATVGGADSGLAAAASPRATCSNPDYTPLDIYFPLDSVENDTFFPEIVVQNKPGVPDLPGGTCGTPGVDCPIPAAEAKVNGAISFDGSDLITVPNHDFLNWSATESFSLELWVKTSQSCSGNRVFVGKPRAESTTGEPNYSQWWLGCDGSTNAAAFHLRAEDQISVTGVLKDDAIKLVGKKKINDGQWHHIVAVRNASPSPDVNQLYVDGVLETTLNYTFLSRSKNPEADFYIGGFGPHPEEPGKYQLNGTLDEFAIFNKALSGSEVSKQYNGGAGQSPCNDDPIAGPDAFTTNEDQPLVIDGNKLLENDSDVEDGDEQPTITAIDLKSAQAKDSNLTGTFPNYQYTPPSNFSGSDTFQYTIKDSDGEPSEGVKGTVTITVNPVPDAPVITTNPGAQTNNEGDTIQPIQLMAEDADNPAGNLNAGLTFTATGLPTGLNINSTGLIAGTIDKNAGKETPYLVRVTVSDGALSSFVEFPWTVNNVGPAATAPGDQQTAEGAAPVELTIEVDKPGTVTFSDGGTLPPGLTIDPSLGKISGTIDYNLAKRGENKVYQVMITVADKANSASITTLNFKWTILNTNRAPEVASAAAFQIGKAGASVNFQLLAEDPDGDPLTFSVLSGTLPPGLEIDSDGRISGVITGFATGLYDMTLSVSDGEAETNLNLQYMIAKFQAYLPSVLK